jgi:hypothetical protein
MKTLYERKAEHAVLAIQWTGENLREVQAFMWPESPMTQGNKRLGVRCGIDLQFVGVGDWIILGKGDAISVMSDAVFTATYQPRAESVDA